MSATPAALPELLPCPCCKRQPNLNHAINVVGLRDTDAEIITAWNTRAQAPKAGAAAWQERYIGGGAEGRWQYCEQRDFDAAECAGTSWEYRALYTTPPPNPELRALVEQWRGKADEAEAEGWRLAAGTYRQCADELSQAINDLERGK